VDNSRFTDGRFGRPVSTGGRFGYSAFRPAPLPRSVNLAPPTVALLARASLALGRLGAAGRLLPNPHLLVVPYATREALSSSRIEGTQATLSEVLESAATDQVDSMDIREVRNYLAALNHGVSRLESLPVSTRLITEMHALLMDGVRGQERTPGALRTSQNWIGSPDNRPDTAVFVPPPADEVPAAMSDWESFAHEPEREVPVLVKAGLLHYQFETIHPFLDGNGRLGRLLIVLYLVEQGLLTAPLLYTSAYFESHKAEYYDRLQAVRERADLDGWLRFFLTAVAEQAADAVSRAERLVDCRERYRSLLSGSRTRAHEVVDLLLENPVQTRHSVARRLSITEPGAGNLLRQLTDARILEERSFGRGIRARWYAREVLDLLM